jgi:hypothetical protein
VVSEGELATQLKEIQSQEVQRQRLIQDLQIQVDAAKVAINGWEQTSCLSALQLKERSPVLKLYSW